MLLQDLLVEVEEEAHCGLVVDRRSKIVEHCWLRQQFCLIGDAAAESPWWPNKEALVEKDHLKVVDDPQ